MKSKQLAINKVLVSTQKPTRMIDSLTTKKVEYKQALADNPDLPESFVRDVVEADIERRQGILSEYRFGWAE